MPKFPKIKLTLALVNIKKSEKTQDSQIQNHSPDSIIDKREGTAIMQTLWRLMARIDELEKQINEGLSQTKSSSKSAPNDRTNPPP